MIKLTYDCKLGAKDLYLVIKDIDLVMLYDDSDIEEEIELFDELKNYTDEQKIDFVYKCENENLIDLLTTYFSAAVLDHEDFADEAELFDVSNVRITRE